MYVDFADFLKDRKLYYNFFKYCDMMPESQITSLLGNGSVKKFPGSVTIEEPVPKQQISKNKPIWVLLERCFLFGPCRMVTKKSSVPEVKKIWIYMLTRRYVFMA
jgi:hypothetical protein